MLTRNNSILHIIDVQERIFNVMHNNEFLKENMVRFLKGIQVLNIPVVWMEQYPKGLGHTIPELRELMPDNNPLEKMCFSSCNQPDFLSKIKTFGKKSVLVMGIETHVCVYQTVIGLLANGFEVEVVADAVSSRTEKNYELGLRIIESLGAKLTTVEMALFELLKESGTDEFKQISRLVK
ncbi:MAG: hydrolase [Bacteroidota bacterium]|nr:hydrolase [Bacteroidota bacterium]